MYYIKGFRDFNPRTREGCDVLYLSLLILLVLFQSTHPRRVRHLICDLYLLIKFISIHAPAKGATWILQFLLPFYPNFNPRTREGCDDTGMLDTSQTQNFNPRTREGCDEKIGALAFRPVAISIHAPAKGAT